MRNLLLFILIILGLSFFAQKASIDLSREAESLIMKADTTLANGDLSGFSMNMDSACTIYRQNEQWTAYFSCELKTAETLIINGLIEDGRNKARIVAEESPFRLEANNEAEAKAYNFIGVCFFSEQQHEAAITYLKKSLEILEAKYPDNKLIVDNLINIGAYWSDGSNADHSKAMTYYQRALEEHKRISKGNDPLQMFHILNNIGTAFSNQQEIDSAAIYFRKAMVLEDELKGLKLQINLASRNYGALLEKKHQYDSARYYYQKVLNNIIDFSPEPSHEMSVIYSMIGANYHRTGKYFKALETYLKGLEVLEAIDTEGLKFLVTRADLYNNLGATYLSLDRPREALMYHKEARRVYSLQHGSKLHPNFATAYSNIASDYKFLKDYDTTLVYYQKALEINEQLLEAKKTPSTEIAHNYINIGETYFLKNNLVNAESFYRNALHILNPANDIDYWLRGSCYHRLGNLYRRRGEHANALTFYRKAMNDFKGIYDPQHPSRIKVNSDIGYNYHLQGDNTKSLSYYQEVFYDLEGKDELLTDMYVNPSPFLPLPKNILLPIFHRKAIALGKRYETSGNTEDLIAAAQTITICDKLLDSLRVSHIQDRDVLGESAKSIYEDAIHINYQLYQLTKDKKYIDQAFSYSEKSKGIVMLLVLLESGAKEFANIPKELLDREHELRTSISNLESSIAERGNDLQGKLLFKKHQEYQTLIEQLEVNYNLYYKAKYDVNIQNIQDVQTSLIAQDKAAISYFLGEENLHSFIITQEDYDLIENPADSMLYQSITDFNTGIYGYWQTGQIDSTYNYYQQLYVSGAVNLYERLLTPALEKYALPSNLLIIPDEELSLVSFSALLTEIPSDIRRYSKYPYLLRDHQIEYAYSATLLAQVNNRQRNARQEYIGFAPAFPANQPGIANYEPSRNESLFLEYNKDEVVDIQKITGGDTWVDEKATRENFVSRSGEYRMIHLATHGILDDNSPKETHILFSDSLGSLQNNKLTIAEIYNLDLNADMVTLSACKTSLGARVKGEGMISLARAFMFAGAKNVTATLWDTKDHVSYKMMVRFYELLAENLPKDQALRQSQLDYLDNKTRRLPQEELMEERDRHPYFWAGYISIGDTSSLEIQNSNKRYFLYGITLLFLIFLGLFFKGILFKKQDA